MVSSDSFFVGEEQYEYISKDFLKEINILLLFRLGQTS